MGEVDRMAIMGDETDCGEPLTFAPDPLAGAVEAARAELLGEITQALRLEGFTYMNYGPRAADFIDTHFRGQ